MIKSLRAKLRQVLSALDKNTERKWLEQRIQESLERRGRQVQITTQISQEIAAIIGKEQLYGRVVTLIKKLFGFYNAHLFRYDSDKQALVLAAAYGESGAQMLAANYQVPLGHGLIGAAAASGAPILRPDISKDPNWQPNPYLPQVKGELAVPIKSGREDGIAQAAALQYFIDNGFDGIIVAFINPGLVAPITQKAVRQNIPVVSLNAPLGPEKQTASIQTSEYEMGYTLGRQAGAWAKKHISAGQSLKVGLLNYRPLPQLIEREEGIMAGLKQIFKGELEIVAGETAGDAVQSLPVAERWLKSYPDLNMILGINDAGALGAYQAVTAAGKDNPDQFFIGGIDAIEDALALIKMGSAYQATVDISSREAGILAVRCLVSAIKGSLYQPIIEIEPRPVNQANLEAFLKEKEQAALIDQQPWEAGVTALDLTGIKIGLSIITLANPFYVTMVNAARAEAERLGVELVINEPKQILGVLAVQSDRAGVLDAEDQLALEGVASQIAVALEKTRLLEMVEERTQELQSAQERLIRQEKLAVLGQLAGGVGHELRNPLGIINNAIYFLQMVLPEADETVKEYLELIAGRVQEAEKIVSDLLNLSRNRTAECEETAMSGLIAEVLDRHPPPEAVQVTTRLDPKLPAAYVDPQHIRQVLANLVTNAYQAMPGGGELTITGQTGQNQVIIHITDTGHGMSPQTKAKIFEPLFTTKTNGIGLGLAVSRNLVEVNRGIIEVESIEGQGSTFTIILPTREKQHA